MLRCVYTATYYVHLVGLLTYIPESWMGFLIKKNNIDLKRVKHGRVLPRKYHVNIYLN